MPDSYFVDTNVFVYARDSSEPQKQPRAATWLEALWERRAGRISVQVLQEYYTVVTSKLQPGLDTAMARADVRDLMVWNPLPIDASLMERAFTVQDDYGFSWWDSMIVAAAKQMACTHLLTEDLQAGQDLGEIVVTNPFDTSPPTES